MSLFSRLFGQKDAADPDLLRQALFAVADTPAALEQMCRRQQALIKQHFSAWRRVPEAIRQQPAEVQAYMNGLVAVAQTFAGPLGDPSLMQDLIGNAQNNPVLRWQEQLEQAQGWMEDLRYRDAIRLLTDLLIDVRGLTGTAVDSYLPITFGYLGDCYFQSGEAEKALAPTMRALEMCRQENDGEGVLAYLGNLYEIHRWLGHASEAAAFAEELASALEQHGSPPEAGRYRRQAALVRAGEPLNRVVAEMNGQRYEMDEVLQGVEGGVRFFFERNRLTLKPCQIHTDRGKEHGNQGRYEDALTDFREAMQADVHSPDPHYQAALTLLHLQRPAEALECYQKTEELAPGWFHVRAELWLTQQIVLGRYPVEMFLLCSAIEDGPMSPAQKVQLAERGLQQAPDLAILHYLRGKNLKATTQREEASRALRRGLVCADESDIHTRILVELGTVIEDKTESKTLLQQAVDLNGNLVAAATARIVLAFE